MTSRRSLSEKLSKKTFNLARRIFLFSSWNKCVPFELICKNNLQVKRFERTWKLLCWKAANWMFTFALLFQLVSFIYETWSKPFNQQLALHLCYVVIISFAWIYMWALYRKPDEAIFMLNQQVFLLDSLRGTNVERIVLCSCL